MFLDFKRGALGAASLFVDSERYLRVNDDVHATGKDPIEHFVLYGYNEGRAPSKWFNRLYLERIAEQYNYDLSSADRLIRSLLDAGPEHYQWVSPCVCPAWLLRQLPKAKTLGEALKLLVPQDGLSIHPALQRITPSDEINTVYDILVRLDKLDYTTLSLVDLEEYKRQHRDIRASFEDPFEIFEHLWNVGYIENRLKYLGVQRRSDTDSDTLLRANFATIFSHRLGLNDQNPSRITGGLGTSLHFFDQEDAIFSPLISYNTDLLGLVPSFDEICQLSSLASSVRAVPKATAPEIVRTKRITDTDLVTGHVQPRGSRVVYSMSTNGHDGIPTPPDLEDCDFFLISDVAGLPEDSPWQLVTPTLTDRDPKRGSLWFKTHPHLLFPNTRFVTWIDANVICMPGSEGILAAHETMSEIATFVHGDRKCVYDEAEAIKLLKLDYAPVMDRAVKRLEEAGMPKAFGLYETNVLFSRCEDMLVREFFDEWWRNIWLGSRRDQMSFTLASWLTQLSISTLDGPNSTKKSRFFSKVPHRKTAFRTVGAK